MSEFQPNLIPTTVDAMAGFQVAETRSILRGAVKDGSSRHQMAAERYMEALDHYWFGSGLVEVNDTETASELIEIQLADIADKQTATRDERVANAIMIEADLTYIQSVNREGTLREAVALAMRSALGIPAGIQQMTPESGNQRIL